LKSSSFKDERPVTGGLYGSHGGAHLAAPANIEMTQTMVNWSALAFGISMLAPRLIPGLMVAGILVVNGLLLFRLASILWKVTGMQQSRVESAGAQ